MELTLSESELADRAVFNITEKHLMDANRCPGKWQLSSLPSELGHTEFTTCRICEDISLTRSRCTFSEAYISCIRYQLDTTLLIFGFEGISSIGFKKDEMGYLIRPGDVWLVNTGGNCLYRYTSANQRNEMVVIKYATKRISFAFPPESKGLSMNRAPWAMRLGYQEGNESWISDLMSNPFSTSLDCLAAEAKTLDVMARWLRPLVDVPLGTALDQAKHPALEKVIQLLTADLANTPSLDDVAKQVGMSHTRLNRSFKKSFGKTVFSWLRDYRLARARSLLNDKQRSITDIAFMCGFSSASHFSQAFRHRYAFTPVEFRNNPKLQEVYCEYGIN